MPTSRKYRKDAARVLAEMALRRRWAAEDLGERLQQRRVELGLTQEQLADRIDGVTLRAVQRWLNGETVPQDRNIYKVAAALEMDPDELMVDLVPQPVAESGQLDRMERLLVEQADQLQQIIALLARRQTRAAAGKARASASASRAKRRKQA